MLSIIYPYRERDLRRIEISLKSLEAQSSQDFEVYFVDYGSSKFHATEVKYLLSKFPFVSYNYLYTNSQPWNKSKALNSVIKELQTNYFFVADIDMIFHPSFVKIALELSESDENWYFKVGFLNEVESKSLKPFEAYTIKFLSNKEATGLTLCSVKQAQSIRGFDEFYHFWGSEDTDFHIRLINKGYMVNYYDSTVLMLHQWHEIYRNKEVKVLSDNLQLSGIVQYNQNYLKEAIKNTSILVNKSDWGTVQTASAFNVLEAHDEIKALSISISKMEMDYFLFQTLPKLKAGVYHFVFNGGFPKLSLKQFLKQLVKGSNEQYYTLKEINDKILFHIINFYHKQPYKYIVNKDLKKIYFSIIIKKKN